MYNIIGAVGEIKEIDSFLKTINVFSKKKGILIQTFDANLIFGKNHIISAYNHANRAFERNTNTTNSLEMEILLYSSGERQLKLAIPKIGVKKGKTNIAFILIKKGKASISDKEIVAFLNILKLRRDDKVLEGDENTIRLFGIGDIEIETVKSKNYEKLILEKVAMVDLIK